MQLIKYNWFTNNYTTGGQIAIMENCNSLSFTNVGDTSVTVNNKVLYPGTIGSILGDSFSIGGNQGEIVSEKRVTISFGAGANPILEIVQKVYV